MTASKTYKQARDATNTSFNMGFLDESGQGLGPFDATHASVNAGGTLINPATDESLSLVVSGLGSDGSNAPAFPGGSTGTRGWLRLIQSSMPVLGSNTRANAVPVTLATDQPSITVAQTVNGAPLSTTNRLPVQIDACNVPLVLPAGLAQDSSLATLANLLGSLGSAAPTMPGGSSGVTGLLRLIQTALTSTLTVGWSGQAVSISNLPAIQAVSAASLPLPAGASTSAKQPALGVAGTAATDVLTVQGIANGVALPMSAASLPLPAGAATAALQTTGNSALTQLHTDITSTNTSLGSILTTLQAQRAETLWTDDTNAYFVRVDVAGTITWVTPAGAATSAPGAGARPAAGSTTLLSRNPFQASAAGTGYAINDFLDHFITTDPSSGAVIGNFWINTTQGTTIAAPTAGSFIPVTTLPTGAATSALQTSGNASLTTIATAIVAPTPAGTNVIGKVGLQVAGADVSAANAVPVSGTFYLAVQPISATALPLPAGAATAVKQPALGVAGTASADVITVQGVTGMTALKVDGSAVVQPISATALPLPAGAASSAKQPALGTAGTPSADVLTIQGAANGYALPISAAALPLPAGAATAALQTTGNTALTTINTTLGTTNTSLGTINTTAGGTNTRLDTANTALAQLHTDMIAATPAGANVIGRVGLQVAGADVSAANPVTVNQGGTTGTDYSANAPAMTLTGSSLSIGGNTVVLLKEIPATPGRAMVEVQNQSTGTVYLVRDDGAGNNLTLLVLSPPGYGISAWDSGTFKGRLRVYGAAGTQIGAYQD